MGLIMPKNNAHPKTLFFTLGIYNEANDWVSNSELIEKLSQKLNENNIEDEVKEPQSYTKKTQVLSYYGLLDWEDPSNSQSRRRITDNGKLLYKLLSKNDKESIQSLLINILKNNTFGRNVLGCNSDSDLEAPNIFLKSALLLDGLSNKEFAYILGDMELFNTSFEKAILEVKILRETGKNVELMENASKWADPKPIIALADWGLLSTKKEGNTKYCYLENDVIKRFGNDILSLNITNNLNKTTSVVNNTKKKGDIFKFLSAIRTKPFVLLAGISGTGKSRIVRKLAQATVTEELQVAYGNKYTTFEEERWNIHKPENFEIIQVKPNWHNSMDVVGYLSNIPEPHYVFTPFVEFIIKAMKYPQIPFFLCLDEMNLAPVEEYFAEFLSAIESRSYEKGEYSTDPIIKSFVSFGEEVCDKMISTLFPKQSSDDNDIKVLKDKLRTKGLSLPQNLIVIGTVNMDETTFSFSRKVLDRAMSIEMNDVDYDSYLNGTTDNELKSLLDTFDTDELNSLLVERPVNSSEIIEELGNGGDINDSQFVIDYLKNINALLDGTPFKLGYRAANEALLYLSSSYKFNCGDRVKAMDNFTLMKILSRIEGDESKLKLTDSVVDIERMKKAGVNIDIAKKSGNYTLLSALKVLIKGAFVKYPDIDSDTRDENQETNNANNLNSIKKIDSMISQLERDHFVSYWN